MPMKPSAPRFGKSVVRMFGFTLLAFLVGPPLFGAGVTLRFAGEPFGEGDVTTRRLPKSGPKKPETGSNIFSVILTRPRRCRPISNIGRQRVLMWVFTWST